MRSMVRAAVRGGRLPSLSWTAGSLAKPAFYQYWHRSRAPVAAGMIPAAYWFLLVLGLDVAAAMQGLEAAVGAASLTTEKLESLAEMAVGVAAFALLQTAETAKQAGKVGLGATVMGVEKAEQVSCYQSYRIQHMGCATFAAPLAINTAKQSRGICPAIMRFMRTGQVGGPQSGQDVGAAAISRGRGVAKQGGTVELSAAVKGVGWWSGVPHLSTQHAGVC